MNTTTELLSDERLTFMDNIVPELDCFKVQCISDRKKMNLMKRLMKQVDRLYYTSKVGHESFTRELRWTEKEVLSTKDGVDLNTMDLTPTERAGFEVSKNWEVVSYLNDWNLGEAYSKLTEKGVNAASAVGVIVGPEIPEGENYFALGRTIQRLWLEATKEEVALQPMSIATFLMLRANYDAKKSLGNLTEEYIFIEGKMKELLNLNENERPVFIFRLTLAEGHKTRALRRPLSEVFMQL